MPATPDGGGEAACERCGRQRAGSPARCLSCGSLGRAAPCAVHRDSLTTTSCVVCGSPLCLLCRRGSRHTALCARHEGVLLIEGWAEAFCSADELEARFTADGLSGEGIPARVLSQKDRANVVTFGGLSIVRVLVPVFHFEQALAWIGDHRGAGPEPGDGS